MRIELWRNNWSIGQSEGVHHILHIQLVRLREECSHCILVLSIVQQQEILASHGYIGRDHEKIKFVHNAKKTVINKKLTQGTNQIIEF